MHLLRNRTSGCVRALIVVAVTTGCAVACGTSTPRPKSIVYGSFGAARYAAIAHGTWTTAAAVRVQPNGYIVTAGETKVGGAVEMLVARYAPDGRLDTGFGNQGTVTVSIGHLAGVDSGAALALQPDGKILVAGAGTVATRFAFAAVRLTQSGSLDKSFGRGGIATVSIGTKAIANAVVVAPDGRILLGGVATINGSKRFAAVRLLPDGTVDRSFGSGGVSVFGPFDAGAWGMVLQRDGSPVLAGLATVDGRVEYMVSRAKPNGAPDVTFGNHGVVLIPIGSDARGDGIALQPGGKLIVTGDAIMSGVRTIATVRLTAGGSIDRSFGSGGIVWFSKGWGVNGIAVDPSGRILLAGGGPSLVILNPDGSFDRAFGAEGVFRHRVGTSASANGVAIQPSGHYVLVGTTELNGRLQEVVVRVPTRIDSPETQSSP